jgi:tetratricopeptide (TPR) repeat protein
MKLKNSLVILLLLVGFETFSQDKETNEYLNIADKNFVAKNYRESLANYKIALTKNPGSIRANLGYAKSSLHLGSRQDAEFGFKKTLELDSKNRDAIIGLAEIISDYGNYNEALKLVEDTLKEDPYHQGLLLSRANLLLKSGKKDLALMRLEQAKSKVAENLEFKLLLAKVHTANKNFDKSEILIDEMIAKYPESPEPFILKSELNFERLEKSENPHRLMKETNSYLITALALDGDNTDAKRLIIKNLLWLANKDNSRYEEAKKYTNELLEQSPNDPFLQYISGFINLKLSLKDDTAENYLKLLEIQELNEIGRFAAENYSIDKLDSNHILRVKLGKYRLNQYKIAKNDYYYDIAYFHLMRAEKLIPQHRELQKELLDYYYKKTDLYLLLQYLIKERDNDIEDMKIHNRLENAFHRFKQTLIYREGFTNKEGKIDFSIFNGPEIFIFDPKPEQSTHSYPDSSLQIANAIKFALSLRNDIRLVKGTEEEQIRNLLKTKKGSEAYTDAIYYTPEIIEYLNQYRKADNMIRYIGYGTFSEDKNKIILKYKLYDRVTGKVLSTIHTSGENRNAIAEISTRIAQNFTSKLPLEGKIIKIKSESVLISLGTKHGIKKDQILPVYRNNKEISKVKITNLDEYISEGIPEGNWTRELSLKDRVSLDKKDLYEKKDN